MRNIFNTDGTLMNVMSRIADIVWLNLLFLLCSIPVITIGASATALYYVVIRMTNGEEGYVAKSFFRSFRQNLKQSTVLWLVMLSLHAVLFMDLLYLQRSNGANTPVGVFIVMIPGFIVLFTGLYVFPLQARFDNSTVQTLKNALLLSIANIPRTVPMLLISFVFPLLCIYHLNFLPLFFLCAFSLPAYLNAAMLYKVFEKITPKQQEASDDEGIFAVSRKMEKDEREKE